MSFSSWRFKSSLRHQKLFSSYISWPVEAGAPDRQFLSSAPKFSNLYCLARGGRSAGPSIPLFGTKNFLVPILAGSWRPERRTVNSSLRHQNFHFCIAGSWRPESPGRKVVFSASNLEFLWSMVREALFSRPPSPLNARFARFWPLIWPFLRYLDRFHLFC